MEKFFELCNNLLDKKITLEDLRDQAERYNIYPKSIYEKDNSILFMLKHENIKHLIILGEGEIFDAFEGSFILLGRGKFCETNHTNSQQLRRFFPFTSPVSYEDHKITLGLGDRLGLASVGHVRLLKDYDVFPVLAQQSIRELDLTGRNYNDVLDSASWAVFQEGYESGFGADGDHLKTAEEVKMAIDLGYTMITLDCSDHIDNSTNNLSETEVEKNYLEINEAIRSELEERYLDKTFSLKNDISITFNDIAYKRIILIYLDTILFTTKIYKDLIVNADHNIDFELSIDETTFETSVEAHFLIASELIRRGVNISSLAPRFHGEFQKGIDYIGNKDEFEKNFYIHFLISENFDYKISVHSGSDKFTIFPVVGDITKGKYHLKTAGTNWLEALRVIAVKDTVLFRDLFNFALNNLDEARAYYYISGDPDELSPLESISDKDLVNLLDDDNARQILHITYGLILEEKNDKDEYVFRNKIFEVLNSFEDLYSEFLISHIGKHLKELGIKKI